MAPTTAAIRQAIATVPANQGNTELNAHRVAAQPATMVGTVIAA